MIREKGAGKEKGWNDGVIEEKEKGAGWVVREGLVRLKRKAGQNGGRGRLNICRMESRRRTDWRRKTNRRRGSTEEVEERRGNVWAQEKKCGPGAAGVRRT